MDTDALQRTLDAIDAVTADVCGWCGATLTAKSPSPNYCTEEHQERWLAHNARPEPLAKDALAAMAAAGYMSDELLEAYRIWNDREPLDNPMPVGALFEELMARQLTPPTLFTSTTPDDVSPGYRHMIERRLSYGIGLSFGDSGTIFRNITVA